MRFRRRRSLFSSRPRRGLEQSEPLKGQVWTRSEQSMREPGVHWAWRGLAAGLAMAECALLGWLWFGPALSVQTVAVEGTQHMTSSQVARAAGLGRATTGGPGIPGDTGTTVFAVTLDGSTTTTRLALGGGAPGPGGPGGPGASSDPASAAARDILARLSDPSETWGAASSPQTTLVPTGYLVYVAPGALADQTVPQSPVAWPLATPLAAFGVPAVPDRGIVGLRLGRLKT